ncbi:MAG: SGNH/GDSL hydrolase family protein [Leptospiraceae bacterium]|nr:SGNH/GDSL hydrolase family protein [Leptospiraceae bacterium]MCB1319021.1 SGNH/GDSL hydrolase family protein [Leptospiraceae bacterium]
MQRADQIACLVLPMLLSLLLACADRNTDNPLLPLLLGNQPIEENRVVLVIGDSLTEYSDGFHLANLLGPQFHVYHRGVGNRDFPYWTVRLNAALQTATEAPADHIVVALGTNDAFQADPTGFIQDVYAFHRTLRGYSQARVYYLLVPETGIASLQPAIRNNNARLALEVPTDNTVLVDIQSAFESAPDAALLYSIDDPLHPTERGYALMGDLIQQAVREHQY